MCFQSNEPKLDKKAVEGIFLVYSLTSKDTVSITCRLIKFLLVKMLLLINFLTGIGKEVLQKRMMWVIRHLYFQH